MAGHTWDDFPAVEPGDVDGWWELDESGTQALLAWECGPALVARTLDTTEHITHVTVGARGGPQHHYQELRADEDQECVDEGINDFLGLFGVPARPGGFLWHLRPPPGWAVDQVLGEAHRIVSLGFPDQEVREPIRDLVRRLAR